MITLIRWMLTLIMLVFIWIGNMFAIKLALTLEVIGVEIIAYKMIVFWNQKR